MEFPPNSRLISSSLVWFFLIGPWESTAVVIWNVSISSVDMITDIIVSELVISLNVFIYSEVWLRDFGEIRYDMPIIVSQT